MKMLKRIAVSLLGVILIAYMLYHAVIVPYNSIKTESAIDFSAKDTIEVDTAYIIRNETLVESGMSGVYSYRVENGHRVSNGGVIADVYSNTDAAEAKMQIQLLDRRIENLETLNNMSSSVVVSLEQLDSQLDSKLIGLLNQTQYGDLSGTSETEQEYLDLLNRRLAVTGNGANFEELIRSLKAQGDKITASSSDANGTVSSPCAGYFVSSVDGYETVLNSDVIETLTPSEFDSVKPDPDIKSDAYVGKIVGDAEWYIAVKVSFDESLLFYEGMQLYVEIPTSTMAQTPVSVKAVNKSAESGEAVVIFSCNYMSAELSLLRAPSLQIVLKRYDGLRVSSGAIRAEDGKRGVYVAVGSSLKFVPVTVLYNGNGYVVCKKIDPMESGLHLYDDIVVKGKGLYDGKPI